MARPAEDEFHAQLRADGIEVTTYRLCAECGGRIRQIDGVWRHLDSARVCKDGLSQRTVIGNQPRMT